MKIKKLLSSILAVALTASCIGSVMVSNVSAAYYNELSTIFEENYDGETVTAIARGTGEVITDESTGNKYMKMNKGYSASQFSYTIPTIATGKIMVQFDYMKDAENKDKQSYFYLADSGDLYTPAEYLCLLKTNNLGTKQNKMMAFKSEMIGPNAITEAGQWYTIVEVIDMDTHEAKATLYKKGNPVALGTSYYEKLEATDDKCGNWPKTRTSFCRLAHYGDADAYVDNISIKYVEEDPDIVFAEDYDGPTITGNVHGTGNLVTDETTGNTYMEMKAGWGNDSFVYTIPELSTGKYSIEFDYMKKVREQSYFVLGGNDDAKNWLRLLGCMKWGDTGSFTVFNSDVSNQDTGLGAVIWEQWYTQKITVDIDSRTVSAAFYKKGEDTPIATSATKVLPITTDDYSDWPATSKSFTQLRNFGAADSYIDNIKITRVYETPELDSASVVIKTEDGTVQGNWNEVNSVAKIITLDFRTTLDADTVTADSVYVTKKNGTDKIAATVTCTGGVATITATNNWESGTYTIHATNTVANPTGDTLAENFEIDFTVPAKKIEAQIYDAYIGEDSITQYTQLNAGDELLLYTAVNIEGSAAKLIVAYYDVHGAMVKAESNDVTLSVSTPIAYTVADCAASSVTFFLWDGFTNIAPLGTSFSLQN